MCRAIKTLYNFKPPATDDEIRASSRQFVRLIGAGVSPSARQVHMSALPGVANSLTLLKDDGTVKRDLSAEGVASVWIDVTGEVHRIEVYGTDDDGDTGAAPTPG